MRREWGSWIRERKWREFEALAKSDPSQPLADTVAELERGFPEKADRKALRKVLFLLGQQGYHPREIAEEEGDAPLVETGPSDFAHMTAPNPVGTVSLTYGRFVGGKCCVLFAEFGDNAIGKVDEHELPKDRIATFQEEAAEIQATAVNYSDIPTDFARWRLNQAILSAKEFLPPTIAYWRTFLERTPMDHHPAEDLPRTQHSHAEMEQFMAQIMAPPWEFSMGDIRTVALRLLQEAMESKPSDEEFVQSVREELAEVASELLSPATIQSHATRFLDTALIWNLRDHDEWSMALSLGDDLRKRTIDSVYATVLLQRACDRIVKTRQTLSQQTNPGIKPL